MNKNSRIPGHLCFQGKADEMGNLWASRPKVSFLSRAQTASSNNLLEYESILKQVDWQNVLEKTGAGKDVADFANKSGRRVAGIKAFHRKFYGPIRGLVFDEPKLNASGNFRGIVSSAKWRGYFNALGTTGAILQIIGIPLKAAELNWDGLSTKGIGANVATTMSQWAAEDTLLGPANMLHVATKLTGLAVGAVGYKETERSIKVFGIQLEEHILETKQMIDKTLSVSNARDVLTWDRSFINPKNWQLLKEGISSSVDDLAAETVKIFDSVVPDM